MKVFLAGSGWEPLWMEDNFFNFYRLESFYYITEREAKNIPKYKAFLLDSGAFTFLNNNAENVDWDKYVEDYARFINTHKIKHFFELDIDSIIGIKEVERLRYKLESLTNKKCIPVWHKSRGLDYWKKMLNKYNYVAIGGIVTKEIKPREYNIFIPLLKMAKKTNTKVHGLGFTNTSKLHLYPFYSVDSTSWLSGNRFGAVDVYKGNGKMEKHTKPKGKRVKHKKTVKNNFYEWIKYVKYAEKKI